MRRRRQALPCVLATALFLLPHPGSCPLLKGLQSAECRHAFFAVPVSPARLEDPFELGKLAAAQKKPASTRLSRGGIGDWAPSQGMRDVASRRLSTHMYWSAGEPSPMYGAIRNWLNCSVGCAPV